MGRGGFPTGLSLTRGTTIRGLAVNGWSGAGIYLQKEGANVIEGNFIGTLFTGVTAAPNGFGVLASAGSNHTVIGGTTSYAMNVIAGNTIAGIRLAKSLTGSADANTVAGNYIGLNKNGAPLGNGIGIQIWTRKKVIGNNTGWNHIVTNTGPGSNSSVQTRRETASNSTSSGAWTRERGTAPTALCCTAAHPKEIGQPGQYNYIAQNDVGGIAVLDDDSPRISLRSNFIYFNGELSIDLAGDGITTNDKRDVDSGPNQRQNVPKVNVVQFATNRIKGVFQSRPNTKYKIDFYGTMTVAKSGNTSEFGKCKLTP